MILQSKLRGPVALLAMLMLAVAPVWSQEEAAEEEERPTHSASLSYEGWVMQPAGLDYSPATISNPFVSTANQKVQTNFGTERTDRFGFGYRLPRNMGQINGFYQTVGFNTAQEEYEPGRYIYGETLAFRVPEGQIGAPGVNDDGFADGFVYSTATTLREWAVTYQREAFRTQRVDGRWSIGWRGTRHRRNQEVNYYATISPLPPLLPPTADCVGTPENVPDGELLNCSLTPAPDTASVGSTYDGRGPMAAFDVDINLWRDKLILETGAAFTVQRGKLSADYVGTNHYYICTGDAIDPETGEGCQTGEIVTYPFSQISQLIEGSGGTPTQVSDYVDQESFSAGTQTNAQSATSNILDLFIGFRYETLDWFDVAVGFRSSRYDDVGLDLIPRDVSVAVGGAVGIPTVVATKTSVTYEGFYITLRFRFF